MTASLYHRSDMTGAFPIWQFRSRCVDLSGRWSRLPADRLSGIGPVGTECTRVHGGFQVVDQVGIVRTNSLPRCPTARGKFPPPPPGWRPTPPIPPAETKGTGEL